MFLASSFVRGNGYECRLCRTADFDDSWPSAREVFSTIVVLELLADDAIPQRFKRNMGEHIRRCSEPSGFIRFFEDPSLLPPDMDCTAVGVGALWRAGLADATEVRSRALRVVRNVATSGEIQVYADPSGERANIVDPVVCVNALYLINLAGLADDALATEKFLERTIAEGSFITRSRYYFSEDAFFFFASRLVQAFPNRYGVWRTQLASLIRMRSQVHGTPLELAQRVIALRNLNLSASREMQILLAEAPVGIGWPACPFFRYGRRRIYFGSSILTTAFVARALKEEPLAGTEPLEQEGARLHKPSRVP